ncbi:MAG: hypothetical protein IPK17_39025 [Chloroflexi bacterium]|uniref:hypothetical protein n=1 Tax=Candidatus Flexifilum breve TaxID=3140694 RepID=UPI0031357A6D|nr:hypothetical protein [Chloroflexota bacterium]
MKKTFVLVPVVLALAAHAYRDVDWDHRRADLRLSHAHPSHAHADADLRTDPGYPTLVPFPTALPPPTVTPYAIRPPAAFYRGDAIFTRSPQAARFRLVNVSVINTPAGRTVAVWELEIKNLSGSGYDVFPAYQSYVSQLVGGATGVWGASTNAAVDAGLTVTYEAISLAPNETRTFTLAGFIPYGAAPDRITFMLDPTIRPTPPPRLPGSNALVWRVDTNPYCSAAIADPPSGVLPPP